MSDILGIAILALLAFAPFVIERYLRQLPVAPACPSCRFVARQSGTESLLVGWIPAFARTFLAECARCGWRGRMRWSLAPEPHRHGG